MIILIILIVIFIITLVVNRVIFHESINQKIAKKDNKCQITKKKYDEFVKISKDNDKFAK